MYPLEYKFLFDVNYEEWRNTHVRGRFRDQREIQDDAIANILKALGCMVRHI